jgi:hypothetical protein
MGTWGAGILDDDFARDVYDVYLDAVRGGQAPADLWREAGPDGLRQRKAVLTSFSRDLAKPARPRPPRRRSLRPLTWATASRSTARTKAAVVTRRKVSPSTTSHILTVVNVKLATWANLWKIFPAPV